MRSKAVEVSSAHPSLPSGADSRRPAAVKVAAEPRRSGTLTARTAGKETGREGRIPGRDEEFRNREPAEQFFRGGLTCSMREEPCPSHQAKIPKLTAGEIEALLQHWTNEYACLGYGPDLYTALVDFCELTGIKAVAL